VLLLVLLTLVTYRVTRLITKDTFPPVAKLRARLVGADETKLVGTRWEWFGELITCYWCAGFWVAGVVVFVANFFTSVPLPWLVWPAVAGAAAFISHVEGYLDLPRSLPVADQTQPLTWNTGLGTTQQYTSSR
jgi:Protein of unknown function (DUF1360)